VSLAPNNPENMFLKKAAILSSIIDCFHCVLIFKNSLQI
ncbi:MAG: hypothetical protein ACI8X3_002994, partial [Saprospiraceae bacterium]